LDLLVEFVDQRQIGFDRQPHARIGETLGDVEFLTMPGRGVCL